MVESDETQKASLNRTSSWKIDRLEAEENLLNRFCLKHVTFLREELRGLQHQLLLIDDDFKSLKIDHQANTMKGSRDVDNAVEEYRKRSVELFTTTEAVDSFAAAKAQLVESTRYTEEVLFVHRRQRALFESHFIDADFINFRCDVSQTIAKRRVPSHTMTLSANVTSDGSKERLVLVIEQEEGDDTLKKYINRGGSLIPGSLEDIKKIDLSSFLYNNHMHINRCQAEHVSTDPSGGVVTLVINRPKPFKVYIYSERPFKEVHYFEEFKTAFGRDVLKDEEKLMLLNQQLVRLEQKYERERQNKRALEEATAIASQMVTACKAVAKEEQQLHVETCEKMKERILELRDVMAAYKSNPMVKSISDIEHIFRSNKIDTALTTPLQQLK